MICLPPNFQYQKNGSRPEIEPMLQTSICGLVLAPGLTPSAPKQWKPYVQEIVTDEYQEKNIGKISTDEIKEEAK